MSSKAKASRRSKIWSINNRRIGPGFPTFLILEIGCNFENDVNRAHELIRQAAEAGADAVKFQTFTADGLTTRTAPKFWEIPGCPGNTQYEEFKLMPHLTRDQYLALQRTASDSGIILFSTPEDEASADLLESIGVPLFKISSMNITHFPLLRHVARKRKPIILSTGASTIAEIREAVRCIEKENNHRIALLHCITNYPTRTQDANLNMIKDIQSAFPNLLVGFSDHTKMDDSLYVLSGAVSLGANIIEKHYTFDKSRPGYDHEISCDPSDLKRIVHAIRTTEQVLGSAVKRPIPSEVAVLPMARRSIVTVKSIANGTRISKDMLAIKRPGTGIPPKFLDRVVGSKAKVDIPEDAVVTWSMISANQPKILEVHKG